VTVHRARLPLPALALLGVAVALSPAGALAQVALPTADDFDLESTCGVSCGSACTLAGAT
jgi:hypothetical protein